ncbi:acyl-CoA acyltransferase [Deinococcus multiflagellatus]|uniref:Acyl-CoA acyltransferase n=1 Tax=Deinococcus multiflagellatus TaxID=1656887 RepID=A0ABW1ZLS6_9DEIO|nr:acyl-CoA acyltransferase [Deinococcus multiflagellatus]MBZ9716016.1 acyl-CoA acyltransferase [Deinococcus multiflagellatus]
MVPVPPGYVVQEVTDPWAFRALEEVQVAAWGYTDREVTPGTLFRISAVSGGVVLGAYPEAEPERPVGLAFGFPALCQGEVWHHSHLLALDPACRGSGLALALKHAQRERVLAQGLRRMTWTFDPLVARNARLNLGKLGARARTYLPDWYALEADRARAFPADRLLVEWDLTQPLPARPAPLPNGERVLEAQGETPGPVRRAPGAPVRLAEVPTHPEHLSPATRLAWRLALRNALGTALAEGYEVTDLARDGERAFYVLTRRAEG